jgi:hypothetical protein
MTIKVCQNHHQQTKKNTFQKHQVTQVSQNFPDREDHILMEARYICSLLQG